MTNEWYICDSCDNGPCTSSSNIYPNHCLLYDPNDSIWLPITPQQKEEIRKTLGRMEWQQRELPCPRGCKGTTTRRLEGTVIKLFCCTCSHQWGIIL